jgi:hypothetical protein
MSEVDDKLYLARICYMSDLSEEALKYIEEVIILKDGNIEEEEKNLLFNSLKKLINFRRESWRTINALESKEMKNKSSLLPRVTELKTNLSEEIKTYVNKGLKIIDDKLLKNDTPDELKAMYFKIKGDYTRYIIELTPKDREEEYNILKDKVDEYYKTGLNLCESLSNLNTTKIGLILNYTVFLYEIVKDYKNAYIIANNTYQSITKSLNDDNYDSSLLKDLNKMLNILKENISKWADTVVPEKVENIANDIKTENIEGTS